MSYENKDRYLRVKQNLVLLEMTRLKAAVQVNGKDLGIHAITSAVCNDLQGIQSNFTIPTEMLADSPIYLNLSHEASMVEGMLQPVPESGDDRYKHIPIKSDEMNDAIFKFPVFEPYIKAYNDNFENKSFFDKSREHAGNMIEASAQTISVIRRYAEQHDNSPDFKLGQVLLLVNMVETLEWLFEFTNSTSRRQLLHEEHELEANFDRMEKMYDGLESVLNQTYDFASLTGNESFYCYHAEVWAGTEAAEQSTSSSASSSQSSSASAKSSSTTSASSTTDTKTNSASAGEKMKGYMESVKKVAQNLYKNLMDMLKRVREYFFGEGEQAAVDAAKNATEAVEALNEMQGGAPISDDAAARDPNVFMKALQGGAEFQEILKEYPDLANAIEKVRKSATDIGNSTTVATIRTKYAELIKNANTGIQTVSGTLKRALSEAEKKTGELKNPKTPNESDTTEIKDGVKQENSAMIDAAKEETKKVRLIGGIRNKLVAALNAVSTQSKTVKDKPPQSKFKG